MRVDVARLRTPAFTIPAAIFFFALILRVLGIGWGLPDARRTDSLHPDEPVNILYSQRAIEPARLSFTPDFYNYGTLYLTATRVASDVATTYGGKNARATLIGPRVLSTVAGSLCAAMIAGFFARRGKSVAAWTGGLATAVANGLVVHSRFATVDVLATALLTGGLLLAMRAGDSAQPPRRLLGAATLIGLAAACKYNMALGALGVIVAAMDLPRERRAGTIGLIVITIAVVFLLGVPGALLQTESFVRDVRYELLHTATGHGLVFAGTPNGFLYHLSNLILASGLLTVILGVAGLVTATRAGERWAWVALAFAIPYALLIGRAEVKFLRYVLPLVPILALGLGAFVQRLYETEGRRMLAVAVAILTIGGIDLGGLNATVRSTVDMAGPDPRDIAGAYLRGAAGSGSVGLATDPWFWTATIYPETASPRTVGASRYLGLMVAQTNPRVLRYLPENARERQDFDVRLLTEQRPDFVTMSSLDSGAARRFQDVDVSGDPEAQALKTRYADFTRELNAHYDLARVFGPSRRPLVEDMEYVSPTVYVWKRRAN